jgi:hypothetical protein
MRSMMWCVGLATGAMYLLCLLLKPMTGEVNARFLSAGAIIALNFICIESLRWQDGFEVDRVLAPARLVYFAASIWVLPTITHLLLQTAPGAPDWLPAIAPHVVSIAVSFPVALLAHLLGRLSFTTDEIRAADRRIFQRLRGLPLLERIFEQPGRPSSRS